MRVSRVGLRNWNIGGDYGGCVVFVCVVFECVLIGCKEMVVLGV